MKSRSSSAGQPCSNNLSLNTNNSKELLVTLGARRRVPVPPLIEVERVDVTRILWVVVSCDLILTSSWHHVRAVYKRIISWGRVDCFTRRFVTTNNSILYAGPALQVDYARRRTADKARIHRFLGRLLLMVGLLPDEGSLPYSKYFHCSSEQVSRLYFL